MNDYLLLMHDDAVADAAAWAPYFERLRESGRFDGGSAIGPGACVTKSGAQRPVTGHLAGYIRVRAESLDAARALLAGNPVFEAGGTVEIRALPRG